MVSTLYIRRVAWCIEATVCGWSSYSVLVGDFWELAPSDARSWHCVAGCGPASRQARRAGSMREASSRREGNYVITRVFSRATRFWGGGAGISHFAVNRLPTIVSAASAFIGCCCLPSLDIDAGYVIRLAEVTNEYRAHTSRWTTWRAKRKLTFPFTLVILHTNSRAPLPSTFIFVVACPEMFKWLLKVREFGIVVSAFLMHTLHSVSAAVSAVSDMQRGSRSWSHGHRTDFLWNWTQFETLFVNVHHMNSFRLSRCVKENIFHPS